MSRFTFIDNNDEIIEEVMARSHSHAVQLARQIGINMLTAYYSEDLE